jgi:anti-anti-sigma regulatory factor
MQDEMNPIVLHLPEEFGIYAAGELHRSLKSALDAHQLAHGDGTAIPLRIGARAVETVDASGIQLLIAVSAQLRSVGHRLELVDPSHVLRKGIERLAAGSLLNLEPVAHAA